MSSRRQFLIGAASGGLSAAGSYMHWGEPDWFDVTTTHVPVKSAPARSPLRVLHLSDLHSSRVVPMAMLDHAVTLGLALKPQVILLTGDFITSTVPEPEIYVKILGRLAQSAPTFACLGNHDGGSWAGRYGGYPTHDLIDSVARSSGITLLLNQSREITLGPRRAQIIGVGDLWSEECKPALAFAETPPRNDAVRIVLNHNPDAKALFRDYDWDLMLCGHTHGGQCKLPLIGTPFAPVSDHRYVAGLNAWENRWIFTTRGVGNLHGLRFNCRPEISLLEIE